MDLIWMLAVGISLSCMFNQIDTKVAKTIDDVNTEDNHTMDKRSKWSYGDPCRGIRERKEIRQMSDSEWNKFTKALNSLKRKGTYDKIAAIHRGRERLKSAHGGANFVGWHRIYLFILEELLREEEPCLTIPYWDSTLDYDMLDPKQSVLWTGKYFGNGKYEVTSGPFANWITGTKHNLTRNIGSSGTLVSKEGVENVLSRTRHSQIMDSRDAYHNLEELHKGPHVWVDGSLSLLNEAAEDPVFFFHHAFIDCIWYWFEENIYRKDGIDPYDDYPSQTGFHGPTHKMDPFSQLKAFAGISNRDGYRRKYYKGLYTCKRMPKCSRRQPSCGSASLECNIQRNKCVSKSQTGWGVPLSMRKVSPPAIPQGERFVSKFVDSRTCGDPLPQRLPDSIKLSETTYHLTHSIQWNFVLKQ